MTQHQNWYRADLRDFRFVLFEQFQLEKILGQKPFQDWGKEVVELALQSCYTFVTEVLGPYNSSGDQEGCRLEDGQVKTPTGYKEAWKKLYQSGWKLVAVEPEDGGQGAPYSLYALVEEMICGANASFSMYPGLTFGVAELIKTFGTETQQKQYLHGLFHGDFGATMCLTEPQAGSDVGLSRTRAVKRSDGFYSIQGTKIFISCGDNDFTENVVHMVLARVEGAPPGTKGLSLFIVPKYRLSDTGEKGEYNDVQIGSLEHKMGLNGSATCVVNFGDNNECLGELVGSVENVGMRQMFQLMNVARIAVGIQGLSIGSASYLSALDYARNRKQGASIKNWKDPSAPRVPIIQHAEVRRSLLDMKAKVEGIRALIIKLANHRDLQRCTEDEVTMAYHGGQIDLLVPLVKAYASDQAFVVCEAGIQILGGVGYTRDFPIEQYMRDSKVFSIYEGTNHIQAMDLVGRKLGQDGGAHFQRFLQDINDFVDAQKDHPNLSAAIKVLSKSSEALSSTAMRMLGWFGEGKMAFLPQAANRFLEMMSEVAVGWLLLEAAVISIEKAKNIPDTHPDQLFYQGKKYSALYFAHNVLPNVEGKANILAAEDQSALSISEESFATV